MSQWVTGCQINSGVSCWFHFFICMNIIVAISVYKELQSCLHLSSILLPSKFQYKTREPDCCESWIFFLPFYIINSFYKAQRILLTY